MVPVTLDLRGRAVRSITAGIGRATFRSREIPAAGPDREIVGERIEAAGQMLDVTAVSVGNPHCIVFVPDPAAVDVARLGPALEHHPMFPNRTNVQFVRVDSRTPRHDPDLGAGRGGDNGVRQQFERGRRGVHPARIHRTARDGGEPRGHAHRGGGRGRRLALDRSGGRGLPGHAEPGSAGPAAGRRAMKKVLYVVLDGLGDRPVPELGGRTPLEAAAVPFLGALTLDGQTGARADGGQGDRAGVATSP